MLIKADAQQLPNTRRLCQQGVRNTFEKYTQNFVSTLET